jgi:uncharacterized protein (DUF362 family)/ferredoxin
MSKVKVAVIRCESYDEDKVYDSIKKGIALIGGIESIFKKDEKILLKPNILAGSKVEEAVTTNPAVLSGIAKLLLENNFDVYYGDSPGFEKPSAAMTKCGITQAAEKNNLKLGDFEKGKSIDFPAGAACKKFDIANAVLETDAIVNVCKMKTHALTRITGAVKNLFGCIYGLNKAGFHIRIPNAINFSRMLVDLNNLLKPRLCIMDGIIAMEGNGPRGGNPVNMNCIIISTDPIAVDSTFCRMVSLDPEFVSTNVFGKETGLGTYLPEEIEYLGDPIEGFINKHFNVTRQPLGRDAVFSFLKPFKNQIIPRPVINAEKCIKCGICVNACPVESKNAIFFKNGNKKNPPVYNYKNCIRCYCCQEMCPEKAIVVKKPFLGRILTGK